MGSKKNNLSFKIYSFYNSYVDDDVVINQQSVFKLFGYHINQIKMDHFTHSSFLNMVTRSETNVDFLLFFDIDCIPTSPETITRLLFQILDHKTLAGAAQTANHIDNGRELYIGPFFMGVSTRMLKNLGYPDMGAGLNHDVAQNLTTKVKEMKDSNIKFWWPTSVEDPKWDLYQSDLKFGLGTEYDNLVYHAFESRKMENSRFINKCKEVIGRCDNCASKTSKKVIIN